MNSLAQIVLLAWMPVVLVMFATMPVRRAIIVAYIGGWLFLPTTGIGFPGLPDLTKTSATNVGVLLGIMVFDLGQLARLRWHWMDLPAFVLALCPIATSLSNGLGLYDGVSEALGTTVTWTIPYLIGRMYFVDASAMRELAIGIFIGGLLYIPLCLFEMKFAPVLNLWIYGFKTFYFPQAARMGGWRPVVFMQHGLMVAMWMAFSTFCGWWLWRTRSLMRLLDMPLSVLAPALFLTALFCRSLFAIMLLLFGLAVLHLCSSFRTSCPIILVLLVPPTYMLTRTTQMLPREPIVQKVQSYAGDDRAQSLEARMRQEDLYAEFTLKRPILGWGGWGRGVPVDPITGRAALRGVDGLWTIMFSKFGLVGLSAVLSLFLLPTFRIAWILPMQYWKDPEFCGVVVAIVILMTFQLDILLNAMLNPMYIVLAGGLVNCGVFYASTFARLRKPQTQTAIVPRRYQTYRRV